jgi:signal transduction histidine kinase/ActR/RegA family two-component response regulator
MPRILYVENDVGWFDTVKKNMTKKGWRLEHAPGPREARASLRRETPDVILIDREMPDPDTSDLSTDVGDGLLEEIVTRWRYICTIMLTSYADVDDVARLTRYGAQNYFDKSSVEYTELDRACRDGIRMQLVKRARHTLLAMDTMGEVISEVGHLIDKLVEAPHCFIHLQVGPGGSLLLGGPGTAPSDCKLSDQGSGRFAELPCAEEVLKNQPFHLARKGVDVLPGGSLLPSAASQLIVPVLAPEPSDQPMRADEPTQAKTIALLWLESTREEAFSRKDVEVLLTLADYVGDTHAKTMRLDQHGAEAQEVERTALLMEVAHEICNPLQTAQSNLDLLIARSQREETIPPGELEKRLSSLFTSLGYAISAANYLRRYDAGFQELEVEELDLADLVREVIGTFEGRFEQANCQVELELEGALPKVQLDRRAMRDALLCLLVNAVEAVEYKRERTGADDEPGDIIIALATDPSRKRDVLLSIADSGYGIESKHLPKLFNRYFTTKHESPNGGRRGLGLSQVKRFVDRVHGQIEAMNAPKGGAEFCLLFPTALVSRHSFSTTGAGLCLLE